MTHSITFLFLNDSQITPSSASESNLPSRSNSVATNYNSIKVSMGQSYNKRFDSIHKVASAYEEMGRRLEKELRDSNVKSRKERIEDM